jgi:hypothetical protein
MAILSKGTTYADGGQITSTNLNALVDSATFAAGAVESGGGLQLNGSSPAQLKVAGNVDIGTSNLTATGAISLGATTFNDKNITEVASLAVDTIIADNTDLTIDVAGDIILDAGGADILLKDDGTQFGSITNLSGDLIIQSSVQDKDIFIKGDDNGSVITALKLDMSSAGDATFNNKVIATELDIGGDIDVAGTANLNIVDIDGAVDMATTALVTGVLTTTATQVATGGITSGSSILSDTDSTDSLGSTAVRWLKGWFDTLTAGTLTIGAGSVTDSSGAISFGNENLTTTGTVTAAGTSVFTNLDISGAIDVLGTTNLDVVDIDGAVDMATTLALAGNADFNGNLDVAGLTLLTNALTVTGNVDFNGSLDVLGITNLDVVDIDGNVQVDGTVTVGVNDTGHDVKFYGATSGAYMHWDESTDDLILAGASKLGIGTTSPSGELHVNNSGAAADLYLSSGTTSDAIVALQTNTGGTAREARIGYDYSASLLKLVTGSGFSGSTSGINIDTSGNVGINDVSPSYKLDVNGTGRFTSHVQFDGQVTVGANADSDDVKFFGSTSGAYLHWDVSGDHLNLGGGASLAVTGDAAFDTDTLYVDVSTDRVGIGTASPAGLLEINGGGTATSGGTLIVRQEGDANSDGIALTSSHATSHRMWKDSSGKLNIGPSSLPSSFVQDTSGNVGIGITSPNSKLTIVGDDAETAAINTATATTLEVAGNGTSSNSGGAVIFSAASGAWKFAAIKGLVVSGTSHTVGDLAFSTRNATGDSTLTERMRILYGGNVGIGTAAPAEKLEVAGNVQLDSSNANLLIKQGTGGTTGGMYFTFSSDATKYAGMEFVYDTRASVGPRFYSQNGYDLTVDSGDDLHLQTDSTDRLTILNAGNVGIGTTSPLSKLNVTQSADGFEAGVSITKSGVSRGTIYLETSSNTLNISRGSTDSISIDSSGNVGIGTTSPDESLDVVGAGRFSTGVTFGTDTAAANKLDDYEEGTFTPVLKIGGATTGIGYGAAVGSYTKIGNLVNASLYVLLSSKGSATGSVTIDGLPFASANTTNGFASAHIGSILACTWANYPAGYLSKNTSAITFNQYTEAGGSSAISNSNLTDTSSFIMSITYRV